MAKDVGALTEELFVLKERKTEINAELKELNGDIRKVEMELLEEMHKQGLYKAGGRRGGVYIARQVVPKVVNWDQFYDYIKEHDYLHMLERRVSRKAYQEQYEDGQDVPGVDPVVFDELRTRKS